MHDFLPVRDVDRRIRSAISVDGSRRRVLPDDPFHSVLQLQQTVGNQAAQSLMRAARPSATSHRGRSHPVPVVDPKVELGSDVAEARRRGKADAARIRQAGKLSTEDRAAVNDALGFFEGEARDEYTRQVKPVLEQFAEPVHALPITPPAGPAARYLKQAREAFVEHTSDVGSLSESEANRAADAVELVTVGRTSGALALSWFFYYADHDLEKMSAEREREAQRGRTQADPYGGSYADTKPDGDTKLRPDVLTWPLERLGPLLLHELGHTTDDTNWMGLYDWEEGHPYAVEYFYSGRTGIKDRQDTIVGLMRSGVCSESQRPDMQRLFRKTLATLISLQEVIDDSPTQHLPEAVRPDGTTARLLLDERVVNLEPKSDRLKAITKYIDGHLGAFDELVPTFSY